MILRSAKNRNDEILRVAVDVAKGVREGKDTRISRCSSVILTLMRKI